MKTKKLTLYYKVEPDKVVPPDAKERNRKEEWLKQIQRETPSAWEAQIVKVTYELFNPEVENQRRFFHTCVLYYAIQDMDMTEGRPDSATLRKYREEILDGMLGYDVELVNKTVRKRKSTSEFKSVQKWNEFLEELEGTIFFAAGYEFPDSQNYWDLVKQYGYEQGRKIAIDQLQNKLKKYYDGETT